MDQFPPNSKTHPPAEEDKKIERVTSSEAIRRKKSISKQLRETFVGGNARTAANYVMFGVMLPALREMVYDAGSGWLEKVMFGDTRTKRGPSSNHFGQISYNRMTVANTKPPMPRGMSKRARSRHDFDEIVLSTRAEAEEVLERLWDLVGKYDSASVADLYELVGEKSTHMDHRWGWDNLQGSSVTRLRGQGYLLDLPDPEPFT